MDAIKHYIQSIFCLYIFMNILLQLVNNKKYESYIRIVSGMLMIMSALLPFKAFETADFSKNMLSFEDAYLFIEQADYQMNEDVYEMIIRAGNVNKNQVYDQVEQEVSNIINERLKHYGAYCCDTEVQIDLWEESANFGKITKISTNICFESADLTEKYDAEGQAQINYIVCDLKNFLGGFYNLPTENIYISKE